MPRRVVARAQLSSPPLLLLLPLLFWAPAPAFAAGTPEEPPPKDFPEDAVPPHVARRLEEQVARRLKLRKADPASFDRRGLLPEVHVAGFRLKEHLVLHRAKGWRCSHITVPHDYVPLTSRRLQDLPTLASSPMDFATPRGRVRAMALLNTAALPPGAYNVSARGTWGPLTWGQVYQDGTQVFAPDPIPVNASNKTNGTNGTTTTTTWTQAYNASPAARYQNEMATLNASAFANRQGLGSKWSDKFMGKRNDPCTGRQQDSEQCAQDVGIAISLYEDDNYKVIVLHGGFTAEENDYLLWAHKTFVLDMFESQVLTMWGKNVQEMGTAEQLGRTGGLSVGLANVGIFQAHMKALRPLTCSLLGYTPQAVSDIEGVANGASLPPKTLVELGQWIVVKTLMRVLMPSDRPNGEKVTYLTGSGVGGMHAAMVSMWLKKADDKTYVTYVIAGVGYQCLSRRMYLGDMDPSDAHLQINTYSHVMDAYANAIDRVAGTVCLYGHQDFTEAKGLRDYCSRMVGHSGAELLYRPSSPEPDDDLVAGRLAFDACHYFAHSPWYAAMLFEDELVLGMDGLTDGGCQVVAPVPRVDDQGLCPSVSIAEADCKMFLDTSQALPVQIMIAVAGGFGAFIMFAAVLLYFGMQGAKDNSWVFSTAGPKKKKEMLAGIPRMLCPCLLRGHALMKDRAKDARDRAKEKREKLEAKAQKAAKDEREARRKKEREGKRLEMERQAQGEDGEGLAATTVGRTDGAEGAADAPSTSAPESKPLLLAVGGLGAGMQAMRLSAVLQGGAAAVANKDKDKEAGKDKEKEKDDKDTAKDKDKDKEAKGNEAAQP